MITHDTFNDKSNITIDYIFFFFSVFLQLIIARAILEFYPIRVFY